MQQSSFVMKHSKKSGHAEFRAMCMKGLSAGMLFLSCVILSPVSARAQDADTDAGDDMPGILTYSLPATSIMIEAEAVQEHFFAGPYAGYARKYLGIDAGQKDKVSCSLSGVTVIPRTEADHSRRYALEARGKDADALMLRLTSEGLVSAADGDFGKGSEWRFPAAVRGDFSDKAVTSNLTSGEATLYRTVKGQSSFSKVAVHQDMVVEKSLEKRAAEAASLIFELRNKRLQIVTGDTDATYSGEAMGAAVEELTRLEKEYMTMFTGYTEYQTQKMTFEVVPQKNRESQMYVAFRISDADGLLPADNLSGRPVVLERVPQEVSSVPVDPKVAKASSKAVSVTYRIPAICTVRLLDGMNVVMQTRMPVYQLGMESTFPVNIRVK